VIRGLRSTVLIGREWQVAAVRQAVMSAHAGAGGLVLVTGEAGAGKSRLLGEAARSARAMHMVVLEGRAVQDGGPLRPVAEALFGYLRTSDAVEAEDVRPFRPALDRLLPGWAGAEQAHGVDPLVVLGEAVLRMLRHIGGDAGCLLVLEDLHWADRDTLGVLEYLAAGVGRSRVAVLASVRSDENQPHPLRRLATQSGVATVTLEALGPQAVARMASACVGGAELPADVVEFLVARAGGLPLLVEELLAGLVESGSLVFADGWRVRGPLTAAVPRTLTDLIRQRTAGFPPPHVLVLQAAAVVGRSVDWSLLAPVAEVSDDVVVAALRAAVSAHLLDADPAPPGLIAWRHALVRDAVLAGLLPPEHQRLALRAAEVMEERDGPALGSDGVLVAELYARGGRPDRAARLLVSLARRAVAGGGLRTADVVLARAVELGAGDEAEAERVRVLTMLGRGEDAIAAGEVALHTATSHRVALCLNLARAAVGLARWTAARDYLTRADRPDDPQVQALAADVAYGAGQVEHAATLAARAAGAAERDGLHAVACEALEVVGRCARMSDPAAAAAAFRRAAALAEAHGLVPWRMRAMLGLGFTELLATDTSVHLARARELAQEAGMLADVAGIDMVQASAACLIDGPAAALPLAERSRDLAAALRLSQVEAKAHVFIALSHAVAGRTDEMDAALGEANRLDPGAPDVVGASCGTAAVAALLDRDLPAARDLLDRSIAALRGHASAAPVHDWGLWALVRTALADRDAAARAELRVSTLTARAANLAALHYADAIAAGRTARPADAVALLAAGDAVLVTQHWWRRLLRLLVLEAAIVDGWGHPVKELREMLGAATTGGETAFARTCRDLLRRAGAPVPRRGRGDSTVPPPLRAAGVTSREMDVLRLVAQGLTNAQIAERLFLSRRTVETHVANLLAKTGATGRAGLAPYAGPYAGPLTP
jgi:DNA-binding NarL/FixJ family response regulator